MALKALLLLSLLVISAGLALAKQDPELHQCKHQCKHQRQFDEQQKEECERSCEEYIREKKERERGQHERRRGEGNSREEEEEETQREENPYVFEDKHFEDRVRTEEGRVQVLEKFTKRSKLLRGIENYRVAILEANPHTFIAPAHFDAELVLFVAMGRATITMVREEKRESFNVEHGDIVRVPAGTPVYMINRDENEKLCIVKILQPVSVPGHFEAFHGAGGEDPESFYRAFSWEVLEAALKVRRDQLEKIFGEQRKGSIVKASRQQIRAMSQHEEGPPRIWPFGGESSGGPVNLFHKHPSQSNQFGRLYEAHPDDHKQLQDLDLMVSFANITKGAMSGPYYNSRATKICVVIEGEGFFEMACPHLSSSGSYQKVSGRLRRGVVFVAPAGHPVAVIASQNNNLQVLCFEVNAHGNFRFPLAGKGNIVNEFEREAKELAFNLPSREVERIFKNQEQEFFLPGPTKQQEERGRAFE
ncbi:vicilin Cor a 11.0101-like [Alnus glutinosa]|uniref:vicilin Cor a 11.0101-like n=1 Tax=Alnus glutinosa TaxID=3517 RepID=UPI002D7A3551|nr:vicilin Cor a 11.0101-like [Alnus glutinosa]